MKFVLGTFGIIVLILSQSGFSQSFVNLNFEAAKIVLDPTSPYYPYAANATNTLPGWTVLGSFIYPDVFYNSVSIGTPEISIHDTSDAFGFTPIQGRYSVYLQGPVGSVAIAQSGQVPSTAQSLTFWSYFTGFQVTFNGQLIPYAIIGNGPNYTIYGADISSFAGQTGEMRFNGNGFLDNIQFSSAAVPELDALALFGVGALLLSFFRRRNSLR